jgi:hypothetical protein
VNDIELLDQYGPTAPELSEQARRSARTRLLAELDRKPTRRRTAFRFRPALAGLGLAAALVAGAVVVLPQVLDRTPASTSTAGPIRLVAATIPEFPWSLPGLGDAVFTANPGGPIIAVYLADDGSDVYLRAAERPWLGRTVVDESDGVRERTWERAPGQWLKITGQGRFNDDAALAELAGRVIDQPQTLGFEVTAGLVPDGWELSGFKDESILTYADPDAPDAPGRQFSVQWTATPDRSPAAGRTEGFERAERVRVAGRDADLIQAREFWLVEAVLPDGSGFRLLTPRAFTRDQVLETAAAVRRS